MIDFRGSAKSFSWPQWFRRKSTLERFPDQDTWSWEDMRSFFAQEESRLHCSVFRTGRDEQQVRSNSFNIYFVLEKDSSGFVKKCLYRNKIPVPRNKELLAEVLGSCDALARSRKLAKEKKMLPLLLLGKSIVGEWQEFLGENRKHYHFTVETKLTSVSITIQCRGRHFVFHTTPNLYPQEKENAALYQEFLEWLDSLRFYRSRPRMMVGR